MIQEVEMLKDIIPDFILKLYHILEKKQFEDCICWSGDGKQIHIKNPKKLQDRVLPYFFRHKHVTSFIRQLNMYKFSKVNKISRQRGHMYFRNDNFIQGNLQKLKTIKRAQRQKKINPTISESRSQENHNNQAMTSEAISKKCLCRILFRDISLSLQRISENHPNIAKQLAPIIHICKKQSEQCQFPELKRTPSISDLLMSNFECGEKNMLENNQEQRQIGVQQYILPSICSLSHFEA